MWTPPLFPCPFGLPLGRIIVDSPPNCNHWHFTQHLHLPTRCEPTMWQKATMDWPLHLVQCQHWHTCNSPLQGHAVWSCPSLPLIQDPLCHNLCQTCFPQQSGNKQWVLQYQHDINQCPKIGSDLCYAARHALACCHSIGTPNGLESSPPLFCVITKTIFN